jgi:hypothetical protein
MVPACVASRPVDCRQGPAAKVVHLKLLGAISRRPSKSGLVAATAWCIHLTVAAALNAGYGSWGMPLGTWVRVCV